MIIMNGLEKKYSNGNIETAVLRGINLVVEKGEFVSIIGRSGCGKTTLLNVLGCLDTFDKGTYFFFGQDISKLSSSERSVFRNKKIGYVFQSFNLVEEDNVIGNIEMPMGYAGIGFRARRARAKELLSKLGMEDKAKRYPSQLSGGEQQRVAILRALSMEPDVILMDEPTGNLDERSAAQVMELLRDIHRKGKTLIMVTHDLQIANTAQRLIRIDEGCISES